MNEGPDQAGGPEAAGFALDRRALARAFNRAAGGYDAAAWLQRLARAELIERLSFFALQPHTVLDLGAGTCQASGELVKRYPRARVLALDLAVHMLAAAPRRWWPRRRLERLCADAHALPLADQSVDLIYSSLMLQWSDRPDRLFVELARVLRPNGLLAFVSFGPDSLHELREAWGAADRDIHVSEFPDMPQLGAALMHAGFVEPVMDVEQHRRDYPDADALMRELKRIGAHNAAAARPRGLTGRARMHSMRSAYERLRTQRGLPATFQLLFGVAFRGDAAPARTHGALPEGEYTVPVAQLRRGTAHEGAQIMKARGVFVAGTDTGVGKTRVTVGLLQALASRGVSAAGMKPVAAGTDAGTSPPLNEDVALIRAASATHTSTSTGVELAAADINPYCFEWPISPHLAARRAGVRIEPGVIAAAYARLAGHVEVVVVEGAGGWLAPIGEHTTMADIAEELALPVLLVVGLRLGCLDHALLTARAIAASGLTLLGWIGSVIEPDMQALEDNIASLEQRLPAPRLALLPFAPGRAGDAAHLAAAAAATIAAAAAT